MRDYERRLLLSNYLVAARATSLSCGNGEDAYRLIWMGGYNDAALVVTLEQHSATAIEFLPFNVANQATIKDTHSRSITAAQFAEIVSQLESAGFWSAGTARTYESEGSSWTFEGRHGTSYRTLTRTHPEALLADVGRSIATLSGIALPRRMAAPIK
jgi:hypothetical protein